MTNYKHSSFLCKGLLLVVSLVMGMSAGAYVFPDDGADITGNLDEMQVVLSERTVTFHDVNASDITEPTYSGAVIENLGTNKYNY